MVFSQRNRRLLCASPAAGTLLLCALILFCTACSDTPTAPLPTRTLIVYMIADNDLEYFAWSDINEMERGLARMADGSADSMVSGSVVVYIDGGHFSSPSHPILLKVQADESADIASPIVRIWPEHNSADPAVMRSVLTEITTAFPAQEYGLILWSHGSAWLPASYDGLSDKHDLTGDTTETVATIVPHYLPATKSFGVDVAAEVEITMLDSALPRSFAFIAFDACYMGAVEVAAQLACYHRLPYGLRW